MAHSLDNMNSRLFGEQREAWLWLDRSSPAVDALFAAAVFGAILFVGGLGAWTPVIVALATPTYCLLRWEHVPALLLSCWPVLLLPGLCLLSALWSDAPGATLRYGTFYVATILPAILLGAGGDRLALLKGMFGIFSIYTFAGIFFGHYVLWGANGLAFAGLGGSKNLAGDVAALTLLLSGVVAMWAFSERRLAWLAGAVMTISAASYCLMASKASGALIAVSLALPCALMWGLSRRLALSTRVAIFLFTLFVIALLVATSSVWMPPLFDMMLQSSGKDQGLTGRELLWAKADQLIAARPLLGGGYRHFWIPGNLDAEYIWRAMGVATHYGFNFHNTPRDIEVDLGFVGLVLFSFVMAFGIVKAILATMIRPYFLGIFLCALIVFESPRLFFELIAFHDMHYSTVLVYMILAYGMRPDSLPMIRDISAARPAVGR